MEDDFWCLQLFILSAILNLFTNIKEINFTLMNIWPQVTPSIVHLCTSEKEHFDISHVYVLIHPNSAMYIMTRCVSHMLHQTFYWFQRYRTFVTYNLLAWTWQNKVLHTSTIVGSFLLVMGMIMTFCLLSYPWSSLSKLSLSPSIYLSESPCLDIIYSNHKE